MLPPIRWIRLFKDDLKNYQQEDLVCLPLKKEKGRERTTWSIEWMVNPCPSNIIWINSTSLARYVQYAWVWRLCGNMSLLNRTTVVVHLSLWSNPIAEIYQWFIYHLGRPHRWNLSGPCITLVDPIAEIYQWSIYHLGRHHRCHLSVIYLTLVEPIAEIYQWSIYHLGWPHRWNVSVVHLSPWSIPLLKSISGPFITLVNPIIEICRSIYHIRLQHRWNLVHFSPWSAPSLKFISGPFITLVDPIAEIYQWSIYHLGRPHRWNLSVHLSPWSTPIAEFYLSIYHHGRPHRWHLSVVHLSSWSTPRSIYHLWPHRWNLSVVHLSPWLTPLQWSIYHLGRPHSLKSISICSVFEE